LFKVNTQKKIKMKKEIKTRMLLFLSCVALLTLNPQIMNAQKSTPKIKNIVIVHGAFADASGFADVFKILKKDGYNVTLVQNPCTSMQDDLDATNKILDRQDGPTVLVGHSWGGSVITQAGGHEKVAVLVYIAAIIPAVGESTAQLASSVPRLPENGLLPPDDKGIIYYSEEKFHSGFVPEQSKEVSDFMFASQVPIALKAFTEVLTVAAWTTKPSYTIIPTEDQNINPILERSNAKRAGSVVTEIKSSHTVYMSHPKEVAAVIEAAANAVK
jgi:pimeloyl-ACP methyl ester carboxylesterase